MLSVPLGFCHFFPLLFLLYLLLLHFRVFLFCAMPLLVFFFFHFHSFIILFLVLFLGDVINFLLNFDRLHLFLPLHYHLSLLPVFPFISFVFCKLQFH